MRREVSLCLSVHTCGGGGGVPWPGPARGVPWPGPTGEVPRPGPARWVPQPGPAGPGQDEGVPQPMGGTQGTPPPPAEVAPWNRTAHGVLDTPRSVCHLRSRRRTFLSNLSFYYAIKILYCPFVKTKFGSPTINWNS